MRAFLGRVIARIDRFTDGLGEVLAWLLLTMAGLTAAVVLLRYGFGIGSIAMQEAVTYLHGTVFMLGVSYALRTGAHVRVDIFYRNLSARQTAWINSLGGIVFLLPLCAVILGLTWNYAAEAWRIRETSPEPGGIPAVFLLKSLLPLMAVMLALQGCADILRNALILVEERDR
jgi:TRAP-type mannitol/chloroaromatic compound transport system permease small subunit